MIVILVLSYLKDFYVGLVELSLIFIVGLVFFFSGEKMGDLVISIWDRGLLVCVIDLWCVMCGDFVNYFGKNVLVLNLFDLIFRMVGIEDLGLDDEV